MNKSFNTPKWYYKKIEVSDENENVTPPNVFVYRVVVPVTFQSDPVFVDTYEEGEKVVFDPKYQNWEYVGRGEIQEIMYNKIEMTQIV